MTNPITLIIAHMGYAETSHAGFIAFKNRADEGFESAFEAVNNLAHCFAIKFCEEQIQWPGHGACCIEFKKRAQPGDERCPKCGVSLQNRPLNFHHFVDFIHDHYGEPLSEYGNGLNEYGPWDEFVKLEQILDTPRGQILVIPDNAEHVIALALRGNEFDDPKHRCHAMADSLRLGVEQYRAERKQWAGGTEILDTQEGVSAWLEECRIKNLQPASLA